MLKFRHLTRRRSRAALGAATTLAVLTGLGSAAAAAPSGFPTAASTGVPAGTSLKSSGTVKVTTAGAVISGLDVRGQIVVAAPNVTIRKTRITTSNSQGIRIMSGSAVIEDVDIVGTSASCAIGIGYSNYTARRVDISGCQDGLKVQGNTTVVDSYIHDLRKVTGSHNDGMQSTGGTNIVIRGNTVMGPYRQTVSALKLSTEKKKIDRLVVENNYLYGGGYTVYVNNQGYGPATNVTVRNNVIEKGSFKHGWRTYDGHSTQTWTGNRWHSGELIGN